MNLVEEELAKLQKRFKEAAKVLDDFSRIKQELDKLSMTYKDKLSNNALETSKIKDELDFLSRDYKEYKKYWNENFNVIVKKNEEFLNKISAIGNQTQSEIEQSKTQLEKLEKSLEETKDSLIEFTKNVQFNRNVAVVSCLIGCTALGLSIYSILFLPRNSINTAFPSSQESSQNVVSPSPENSSVPVDFFREAVNKATRAATLAQSAKSTDEWNLVVNEWQSAIDMMKSVPSSSSNYEVAQKKAVEYQTNLNYARQQAERVIPD